MSVTAQERIVVALEDIAISLKAIAEKNSGAYTSLPYPPRTRPLFGGAAGGPVAYQPNGGGNGVS